MKDMDHEFNYATEDSSGFKDGVITATAPVEVDVEALIGRPAEFLTITETSAGGTIIMKINDGPELTIAASGTETLNAVGGTFRIRKVNLSATGNRTFTTLIY